MLVFEFSIDLEVIEPIKILQKPQIIVQFSSLFTIAHDLTQVEILQIDAVQIDILSFILLGTKLRLLERRHEYYFSKIFGSIFDCERLVVVCVLLLLFMLVLYLSDLVVKVLPSNV